jgi:hypothetical protein
VEISRKVTIKAKDEPLVKFLNRLLAEQGLKYRMEDNTIVIFQKETKFTPITQGLNPGLNDPVPPPTVRGLVTDADG